MEQEHGFFEALSADGFCLSRMTFRSMAWEGDTVYEAVEGLTLRPMAEQLRAAMFNPVGSVWPDGGSGWA